MKRNQILVHPDTLETGATYLLRDFLGAGRKIAWEPVRFVSYDACPGIVIIDLAGRGEKLRVPREDLFNAGCV
jgi:hypothetical protein